MNLLVLEIIGILAINSDQLLCGKSSHICESENFKSDNPRRLSGSFGLNQAETNS